MAGKQAVVLIHGIGEQKPMDTLRSFVDAIWTQHTAIHHQYAGRTVWSKPDTVSKSFELRRLTTPPNRAGIRTDFFEMYWAHLMGGTTLSHVLGWARSLLLRKPSSVPDHLKLFYWVIVGMLIAIGSFAGYAWYAHANDEQSFGPAWIYALMSVILLPVLDVLVRSVLGDAARYLHAAPTNVQRRHEIRLAGVELLNNLHGRGYDRIIIVGHSLGSVIGYDILTHAWVNYNSDPPKADQKAMEALNDLEELTKRMEDDSQGNWSENVQIAQRKYFDELGRNGNRWRVTDFVTIGSPLAHAAILMAKDAVALKGKQKDRELPSCLPTLE